MKTFSTVRCVACGLAAGAAALVGGCENLGQLTAGDSAVAVAPPATHAAAPRARGGLGRRRLHRAHARLGLRPLRPPRRGPRRRRRRRDAVHLCGLVSPGAQRQREGCPSARPRHGLVHRPAAGRQPHQPGPRHRRQREPDRGQQRDVLLVHQLHAPRRQPLPGCGLARRDELADAAPDQRRPRAVAGAPRRPWMMKSLRREYDVGLRGVRSGESDQLCGYRASGALTIPDVSRGINNAHVSCAPCSGIRKRSTQMGPRWPSICPNILREGLHLAPQLQTAKRF